MDTEFPETIIFSDNHYSSLSPSYDYFLMKSNADALNLIQRLLLPVAIQFFRDFNIESDDLRNPDSIKLLKRQGIDFKKNREEGIDSREFAEMLLWSGLVYKRPLKRWVTFHSGYDSGFFYKDGGLERLAKALGVDRVAGKSHQAGLDSLLTMQTFLKLLKMVDMSFINRLIEEEEKGVGGSNRRLRSVLYEWRLTSSILCILLLYQVIEILFDQLNVACV
ncbi:hypothetical protein ACSBR2_014586 [Camellia fascicularis]